MSQNDSPRVLIVDDDATTRALTCHSLKEAGFSLIEATHGEVALEIFKTDKPDIVLLDVVMTGMDGFATCAALRKLPGGEFVPIIMVTGLDDVRSIDQAYEAGATDFITKPITYSLLSHRLRYVLHANRAMTRLGRREASLAHAQEIAHIGNWEWNISQDESYWSDEIYRILGLQPRSIKLNYRIFLGFVHPDDRTMVRNTVKEIVRRGGYYSIDYQILLLDGSLKTVQGQGEAILNEVQQVVYMSGTVQDITERKHTEIELTLYRNHLEEVLDELVEESTAELKKINQQLQQAKEQTEHANELIRRIFGRYLSDEIVTTLLETESGLSLGGERREVTILVSDIRGFTAKSEQIPPEEVIKIINLYLAKMTDVITKYQGTIDEFMGDGILVLFGAPVSRDDDTERAVACAIEMQLAMNNINRAIEALGHQPLRMGIAVNTGEVVVGNIGSEKRTKYGVVGNEVNLTYRIESYSKGNQVFISESTYKKLSQAICLEEEMQVSPKGVKQPINIYGVAGIRGKYNLFLCRDEEEFFPIPQPIRLRFAIVQGKHISGNFFFGSLTELSVDGALICCNSVEEHIVPESLSNIRLNLFESDTCSKLSEDIYAKVLNKKAEQDCFYINFTAIPTDVKLKLSTLIASYFYL